MAIKSSLILRIPLRIFPKVSRMQNFPELFEFLYKIFSVALLVKNLP